jgi:hypothetical protein
MLSNATKSLALCLRIFISYQVVLCSIGKKNVSFAIKENLSLSTKLSSLEIGLADLDALQIKLIFLQTQIKSLTNSLPSF